MAKAKKTRRPKTGKRCYKGRTKAKKALYRCKDGTVFKNKGGAFCAVKVTGRSRPKIVGCTDTLTGAKKLLKKRAPRRKKK